MISTNKYARIHGSEEKVLEYYSALVSCGIIWLRGTNVKSSRQQETLRVSAVQVHGLDFTQYTVKQSVVFIIR